MYRNSKQLHNYEIKRMLVLEYDIPAQFRKFRFALIWFPLRQYTGLISRKHSSNLNILLLYF